MESLVEAKPKHRFKKEIHNSLLNCEDVIVAAHMIQTDINGWQGNVTYRQRNHLFLSLPSLSTSRAWAGCHLLPIQVYPLSRLQMLDVVLNVTLCQTELWMTVVARFYTTCL